MQISAVFPFVIAVATSLPVLVQGQEQPLSAIDWLAARPSASGSASYGIFEPPVTDTGLGPEISVTPLDQQILPVGLVPNSVTGLPIDVFANSDPDIITRLIREVPVNNSPAMQTLLYSLLLAETANFSTAQDAEQLLFARVDRLIDQGAVDPAQALIELADPDTSQDRFQRWFDASLLTGTEMRACRRLEQFPGLANTYDARIFCAARLGDWDAATIILDNAAILGELGDDQALLLDVFLHPELNEDFVPPALPRSPTPLTFRLFEAVGEPIPTRSLPRAFASADLRDIAGWKAQLEAAERLSRSGALSSNSLLGLYSARSPAASGGIWDRVRAVQRFDTALASQNVAAVEKTLPVAWAAMQDAQLEVAFAELFAPALSALDLQDPAAQALAFRIMLLSSEYQSAADHMPDQSEHSRFLVGLTKGNPDPALAMSPQEHAVAMAFAPTPTLSARRQALLNDGKTGEALLSAIRQFDRGLQGNALDIAEALGTLRAVGMNDIARRAALQTLLLDRPA